MEVQRGAAPSSLPAFCQWMFTIVIDLGKTLSKVSLWNADDQLLDRQVRANIALEVPDVRRLDNPKIASWIREALARYSGETVSAIVPVGHGAGVVALVDGELAFPPFDYEPPLPPSILARYRPQRDAFAVTGSPALPDGLNFGSQLWWMEQFAPRSCPRRNTGSGS